MHSSVLTNFQNITSTILKSTPQQLQLPAFHQQILLSLQESGSYFLSGLAAHLSKDDFFAFFKDLQMQKIDKSTSLISKGGKITIAYVLLDGQIEFHHHFQHLQITECVGRACKGHILCADLLLSGKSSPYSVTCLSETFLISIRLDQFNRYVKKWLGKWIEQQINFLKKTALFSGIQQEIIRKYSHYFFPAVYKYKEIIYSENDETDYIFLIQEGQIQLRKQQIQTKSLLELKGNDRHKAQNQIKLVSLSQGQFFGSSILNNTNRSQKACCISQKLKVLMMKKVIFRDMCEEGEILKKNIDFHGDKIEKIHQKIAQKNLETRQKRGNTLKKFRKKKKKQQKEIGIEQIKWWGLAEKVKISEKYRMPKPNLHKTICSRKSNDRDDELGKFSIEKKIDELKKRILKGQLDDLNYHEALIEEQQNLGRCNFSPWNTAVFPKTKIKIKMLDIKPKAIDVAEITKKKLLAYAKNNSNFCDRLNFQ